MSCLQNTAVKETTEGVNQMCQELEEIYNEGEQSGELKKQEKLPLLFLIWECQQNRLQKL